MIKVLILDDEKAVAHSIKTLLEKLFPNFFGRIDIAHSLEEATQLFETHKQHLLLFDVNLGKVLSFDFFDNKGSVSAKVIFITGHDNYAINAIKNKAFDYILKPININEFKVSIANGVAQIKQETKSKTLQQLNMLQENVISLKTLESIRLVKLNDIIFFRAEGAYTFVHTLGNEKIVLSKNLKEFEEKLETSGFVRVHHSYLVNALKIKSVNKKDGFILEMINGETVFTSSRKKDAFLAYIEEYLSY